MNFKNRSDAGTQLASRLESYTFRNPIIIALPNGGVPVSEQVSRVMHIPLDVLVVRRITFPNQPELALGAVSEGGLILFNQELMTTMKITEDSLMPIVKKEVSELARRVVKFRRGRGLTSVQDRDVILIDDGLSSGLTAAVATQHLLEMGAHKVTVAIPVCAPDSVIQIQKYADQVVCVFQPAPLYNVGVWYDDFKKVSDEEVISILNERVSPVTVLKEVEIDLKKTKLQGTLAIPEPLRGFVIFAHGSGSSRKSPRNIEVAESLHHAGIGTLLFDLLTEEESETRSNVFDIDLLGDRLVQVTRWVKQNFQTLGETSMGYFGASTGGGAALWAASKLGKEIASVVSRGGRPDLAMEHLFKVTAPTLLIVGQNDYAVMELNREAAIRIPNAKLISIPGATHLFEEPGTLAQVVDQAKNWFLNSFGKIRIAETDLNANAP